VSEGHHAAEVVSRPADVTKADVVLLMLLDTAKCERKLIAITGRACQAVGTPRQVVPITITYD
jgi:hypothetical protein